MRMRSNDMIRNLLTVGLWLFAAVAIQAQTPVINYVSPLRGYPGQTITIRGYNFEPTAKVIFGAVAGNVTFSSDQLIEVSVPAGATHDVLSVVNTSSRRTGHSPLKFLPVFGGTPGLSASDFLAQTDIQVSPKLLDLCSCDFNGDNKPDIITSGSEGTAIDILTNNSTPSGLNFGRQVVNLSARTLHVTCGDLNSDGKPEVVFTEFDGSRLIILTNTTSGSTINFSPQTFTIPGTKLKRLAIRDMDGDGKPDIIVSDQSQGKIYILQNTSISAVSFAPGIISLDVTGAGTTAGFSVDDINGDTSPDLVVTQFLTDNGGYFVATNKSVAGDFRFSGFTSFASAGTTVNVITSDLNEDNRPDIATSLFLSSAVSAFGNSTPSGGSPAFGGNNNTSVGQRPWSLASGDLDGDGYEDISVCKSSDSEKEIAVMHALNPGSSFSPFRIPVNFINKNIHVGDINGDGKPDILFTSVDDANTGINASKISILLNNKCYQPVIEPQGPFELCNSTTQRLQTQQIAGANYRWKVNGIDVKTGPDHFIEAATAGDYTVTIEEVNGCTETSPPVSVSISSATTLPTVNIIANSPVCVGQDLALSVVDVGATKYEWSGPNNYTGTGPAVTITDFRNNQSGRYYLDVFSGTCLIQSTSIVVTGTPAPEFSVITSDGSTSYCAGETASLEVSPATAGYTFQWYDQNGIIAGATAGTYDATAAGQYYVQVTDNVSGCPNTDTEALSISFVTPPTAEFTAPITACAGSEVSFTDNSTVTGTPTYTWDFGDSKSATGPSPKHVFTTPGTYDVTLTVNYGTNVCQDVVTHQIDVTNGIVVEFANSNTVMCEGQTMVLSLTEEFDSYTWSTGETASTITVDRAGTYTVKVGLDGGCEGIGNITIAVNGVPNVQLSASSTLIAPGETVQLSASGLTSYEWSPPGILDDPAISSPTATLDESTLFSVSGMTDSGCQAGGEILINVSGDLIGNNLHPKNFFSPGTDDLVNPTWVIEGIEEYPQCGVEIFDQTGNRLFQATPYDNNWDGTDNSGQLLPDGAYYYIINCEGSGLVKSGSVTLLRN